MRNNKNVWIGALVLLGLPVFLLIEHPVLCLIVLLIVALIVLIALVADKSNSPTKLSKGPMRTAQVSRRELDIMVENELRIIDLMDGSDFEAFVVDLLKCNGYSKVSQTKISGDFGIDVIAYKDGKKYAFQCKRFKSKLGLKPIQEAYAGKRHYNADEAVVITNSEFTKAAMQLAIDTDIIYCDRKQLAKLLENYVLLVND